MTDYIWDIETYPNVFTCTIGNADTRKCVVFEISFRKDQRKELFEYLRMIHKNKGRMVGFNNIGFDYPVLHFLLKNQTISVEEIYNKAMEIIKSNDKFGNIIKEDDVLIPQLDLYKIHHFDNKARATSLKMLEFNMRSDNIEDLPFPVGQELTSDQIDVLLKYNKHDMFQTFLFYQQSLEQIKFREQLTDQYKRNFMNYNDTKIGKEFLIMELEKQNPGCCYIKSPHGRRMRQTKRDKINLNDCIFDYVKFDRPEFQAILSWFKQQTITETKGVFTDILESDLSDVAKYAKLKTKYKKLPSAPTDQIIDEYKKKYPMCWFEVEELKAKETKANGGGFKKAHYVCWKESEALNVVIDGLELVYGTGGIHASLENRKIESNDNWLICDQDVSSFYPNLAIKNRVFPEHLAELFCDIYEDMYVKRKSFGKGTIENAMLKLALNGSYGASNDPYSPLYDPMFTMKITINGQLSLCMLAEKLLDIEGLQIIQMNTDGLTYYCKRDDDIKAQIICDEWCKVTKLELERADYSKMFIRDCNNYIAVSNKGKVKRKGAYCWKTLHHDVDNTELGWHQNHSSLVIPMSVEQHMLYGVDIGEFIRNHKDIYDFMLRTKVPRDSKLVLVDDFLVDKQVQNICRYYISNSGYDLVKVMPPLEEYVDVKMFENDEGDVQYSNNKPLEARLIRKGYRYIKDVKQKQDDRRMGIDVGWKVKVCNDIKDFNGDINYNYYIEQADKLIIGNTSLTICNE